MGQPRCSAWFYFCHHDSMFQIFWMLSFLKKNVFLFPDDPPKEDIKRWIRFVCYMLEGLALCKCTPCVLCPPPFCILQDRTGIVPLPRGFVSGSSHAQHSLSLLLYFVYGVYLIYLANDCFTNTGLLHTKWTFHVCFMLLCFMCFVCFSWGGVLPVSCIFLYKCCYDPLYTSSFLLLFLFTFLFLNVSFIISFTFISISVFYIFLF